MDSFVLGYRFFPSDLSSLKTKPILDSYHERKLYQELKRNKIRMNDVAKIYEFYNNIFILEDVSSLIIKMK